MNSLDSLSSIAICLRIVEFLGPRSCCTAKGASVFEQLAIKASLSTFFIHAGLETAPQPAASTLVSMGLVHGTISQTVILADVLAISSNRSFEKSRTSEWNPSAFCRTHRSALTHRTHRFRSACPMNCRCTPYMAHPSGFDLNSRDVLF